MEMAALQKPACGLFTKIKKETGKNLSIHTFTHNFYKENVSHTIFVYYLIIQITFKILFKK